MDVFFYAAAAMSILLLGFIVGSYTVTLKPAGVQNQSLIGLVIFTALAAGLIGWIFAIWGLKGNPTAHIQFLLAFTILVLFPTTLISSTVSASQLYGLRDAIAANVQPQT